MKRQAINPRQLSTKGASQYTGIPEGTFRYLRCEGGGPPYRKINSRCYYEIGDLDAFIEQFKKQSSVGDPTE